MPNSNSITYRRIITKNPMMKALMMTRKLNTKDPEDCIAAVSSPGISIIEYQYSTQAEKKCRKGGIMQALYVTPAWACCF